MKTKLIFEIYESAKKAFQARLERNSNRSMSDALRGAVFYMLSLTPEELRDFLNRCETLEFKYQVKAHEKLTEEISEWEQLMETCRAAGITHLELEKVIESFKAERKDLND